MKIKLAQIILLFVVLTITAILIVQNGMLGEEISIPRVNSQGIEDFQQFQPARNQATLSAKATATYGAEQFYLQLTAIAGDHQE